MTFVIVDNYMLYDLFIFCSWMIALLFMSIILAVHFFPCVSF